MLFRLKADYQPTGDQPEAIERLVASTIVARSEGEFDQTRFVAPSG